MTPCLLLENSLKCEKTHSRTDRLCYTASMTPEFTLITTLVAIFTVGVALAGLILTSQRSLAQRLDRQEQRMDESVKELRRGLEDLGREVAEIKGFLRYDTSPRAQANA